MPSLKEFRNRIASVKSTQKITKAIHVVILVGAAAACASPNYPSRYPATVRDIDIENALTTDSSLGQPGVPLDCIRAEAHRISRSSRDGRIAAIEAQRRGQGVHVPPPSWTVIDPVTGQPRPSTVDEERAIEAARAIRGAQSVCENGTGSN